MRATNMLVQTRRSPCRAAVATGGLLLSGLLPVGSAAAEQSDTLSIVQEYEQPSNAEISVRLAEATPLPAALDTVVIGRDDDFADSMASATMQDGSPLLLVPPNGPVPARVLDLVAALSPERLVLLGGTQAISGAVEETFVEHGYTVERRAGPSRFETAVDIAAREAPEATTAVLARAFASEGAEDPTQAFADALSAGAWAADRSWVVLLSQTDVLTGTTRDYIAASGIERVEIMGGTSAIGQAVEDELRAMGLEVGRTSGADRFQTAVEVANRRVADSAADAARILLVDGQSSAAWAGGFASAAHSAVFDAPVVLASGGELPESTRQWLIGTALAVAQQDQGAPPVRLTCVTVWAACARAREVLGLAAPVQVAFAPPSGSEVRRDGYVRLVVESDPDGRISGAVDVTGPCVVEGSWIPSDVGEVVVPVPGEAPAGECDVAWVIQFHSGTHQMELSSYTISDTPPAPPVPLSPPEPHFTFTITDDCQETATFESSDPQGSSVWDFGDGTRFAGADPPEHRFPPDDGTERYEVTLTETNGSRVGVSTSRTVEFQCSP